MTNKTIELADELGMSPGLASDMLTLAGGDTDLVRKASNESMRLESMKCKIIDMRMSKIEKGTHDGKEVDDLR